jgi:hypothetical protein
MNRFEQERGDLNTDCIKPMFDLERWEGDDAVVMPLESLDVWHKGDESARDGRDFLKWAKGALHTLLFVEELKEDVAEVAVDRESRSFLQRRDSVLNGGRGGYRS